MDIEEFYDADERRRKSAELEFGRDWSDASGRCGVSWIEDTGEVYVMREPLGQVTGSGAGDLELVNVDEHELGVEVLGVVMGRSAVESVMSGWEQKMSDVDGIAWLRDRVQNAAAHTHDAPAAPSEELPDDKG
jgi:hypothetical protein